MKSTHGRIFLTLLCHVLTLTAASGGFNRQQEERHLVINSQQFHDAMKNKYASSRFSLFCKIGYSFRSRTLVYLDSDVELRNYYGWVFPSNPQERLPLPESMIEVSAYPMRYSEEDRPKIDLDGRSLHQMLSGRQMLISKRSSSHTFAHISKV